MRELDFDDKIDVLEELPANIVSKILEKTPKDERKLINEFLNYPEDSAGSLMTPEYISLEDTMTVAEALAHIKRVGMDSETICTARARATSAPALREDAEVSNAARIMLGCICPVWVGVMRG